MADQRKERVKCEIPKCPAFTSNPKKIVLVGHPAEPYKAMQICEECAVRLAHVQATTKSTSKLQ
jgi:hypothetical protein